MQHNLLYVPTFHPARGQGRGGLEISRPPAPHPGRCDPRRRSGAGLGIPTINLDGIDTLIPLDGVYAARVFVAGAEEQPGAWASACNIGPNPTFGEQIRKVEAHLIGFAGDLYGRSVELDFLARLRSTRAFANLDDLLSQIRSDIERARQICAT